MQQLGAGYWPHGNPILGMLLTHVTHVQNGHRRVRGCSWFMVVTNIAIENGPVENSEVSY